MWVQIPLAALMKSPCSGFIYLDGSAITYKFKRLFFEGIKSGISVNFPRGWMRHDGYVSWTVHGNVLHWYAVKTKCGVSYSRWKKLYTELVKLAKKYHVKKMEILVLPIGVRNNLPNRLRKWGWKEVEQTFLDKILRRRRFENSVNA